MQKFLYGFALAALIVGVAREARADEGAKEPREKETSSDSGAFVRVSTASTTDKTKDDAAKDTPPCDSTSGMCSCEDGCCGRARRRCKSPSLSLSVAGIRPSLTNVSAGGTRSSDVGVGVAGMFDSYALDGATHASGQFVLGGGQAGFDGMLAGVVDIGYRLDVTEKQGPFARAAFDGRIQGNDAVYFSALELPRMTLGWQFLSGHTVLEMGARGGPILTGRFNPGGAVRSTTGSWEYGAFVAGQVDFIRLEATAMRIDARHTGTHNPVDVGRAALCAVAGPLGVCGDFSIMRGDANYGAAAGGFQEALAMYSGVTVGFASW